MSLASSHSRAASLTGSPITVYSKRSLAPTLPATASPAATPIPASHSGTSSRIRRAMARPAASASSSGSSRWFGAPNTASAASPSNLLTNPWWRSTSSTITAKKRLSRSTTSVAGLAGDQLRRAHDVDEDHRDVTFFAAEFRALLLRRGGHFAADVAAEQIADAFAFAKPCDHRVEAPLQLAQLGAVEHHQVGVEIALFDAVERRAHHPNRGGGEPGQDPHQDEAEDQREQRENHHRDGELGRRDVLQRQRDDRGEKDAEHRYTGAQCPHRHRAAHDARRETPRRRPDLERLRRDRAQRELGEQVAAGRHDDAAESSCRAAPSG